MASKTLREYLISLGFKVDQESYQKWLGSISRASKTVAELGSEAIATATAIGIMTEQVARHFNDLYYVAQRNDTTVAGLKQIAYGFKQIGLDAAQGQAAVEAIGQALRTNPGLRGLLKNMGIESNDPQKILPELIGKLREKFGTGGYFAAQRVGELFGIDEKSFRGLWQNLERLRAKQAEQGKIQKEAGLDPDDFARRSVDFISKTDLLLERLAVLRDRIASDFLAPAGKAIDILDELVKKFTEANTSTEGALGVGGTIAGSSLIVVLLKKWIMRFLGFGAAAGQAAGGAAGAGSTAIGTSGSAAVGLVATWLLRILGPIGALLSSTQEGNKGETPQYVFDPQTRKWVPGPSAPAGGVAPEAGKGGRQGAYSRPEVFPSARAWGDREAENAGLYDVPNRPLRGQNRPNVKIDQKTEINVDGSGDPATTAAAVGKVQDRVNGDLVRNTVGNMR